MRPRVAVVTSHPVQYNAPLFARLADRTTIDLTVLYESTLGSRFSDTSIAAFGRHVAWDLDLLDGYRYEFLPRANHADPNRRWTVVNPAIVARLAQGPFDAVVVFGWAHPTELLAYLTARACRLPYLLYSDSDVRDAGHSALPRLRKIALQNLIRGAFGALYTGTFNRDFYLAYGLTPERLWFSPWAVDTARFVTGERESTRRRLGLRDDRIYAMFCGTLIERKRPGLFLESVRNLQAEGHPLGALIVGSGPLGDDLTLAAQGIEDVHMLGFVNQTELPDLYAAADVFVLPSDRDPRATVVNEAMAAGLPVIVSDGTGVWGPGDLIRHGSTGFVFKHGNPRALADAMRLLLGNRKRRSIGDAARRRIRTWGYDEAAAGWTASIDAVVRAAGDNRKPPPKQAFR